ncbi:hypothetical protein FCM35_KLT02534 [Carex littledalei]|uniref:Uncharacterized protein n=1 Tax=Carex littledalei TaxID=544730 RepID=A0A833R417_9POAL|nr:hypothetical protein FCM35_KLT02534 [Carex littledalei]
MLVGNAGEDIVQVEDAENAGEQIGQVEDAENAGEQTGQEEDAMRNSHLSCVKLSTASGGVCRVYFIGVTHRTQKSCNEVRSAINDIKPKVVFLELCEPRLQHILGEPMPDTTWKDVVWCTITGKILIMIVTWFLSKMVADIDACESEFKVAYEEAERKVYAGNEQEMKNLYDACPSLYKILVEDRDK